MLLNFKLWWCNLHVLHLHFILSFDIFISVYMLFYPAMWLQNEQNPVDNRYQDRLEHQHIYRPRSRGDNTFGSVCVCVRPFVCGPHLNRLTLIFGMRVDPDLD